MAPKRTTPGAMIRATSGKPDRDHVGNWDQNGKFVRGVIKKIISSKKTLILNI